MAANVIDYRDVLPQMSAVKTHYRRGDLLRDGPHALRPAEVAVLHKKVIKQRHHIRNVRWQISAQHGKY